MLQSLSVTILSKAAIYNIDSTFKMIICLIRIQCGRSHRTPDPETDLILELQTMDMVVNLSMFRRICLRLSEMSR